MAFTTGINNQGIQLKSQATILPDRRNQQEDIPWTYLALPLVSAAGAFAAREANADNAGDAAAADSALNER